MEQINYNRRHDIKINSMQTREISLLLSFVWMAISLCDLLFAVMATIM